MRLTILFGIMALLFLSGCLDKLSPEERSLCINFSSLPASAVPDCSTQDSCYLKVQQTLFPLSSFSIENNQKLELYKNHLAKSWLLYNNSNIQMDLIHRACESSTIVLIPFYVNTFSNNVVQLSSEIDAANIILFDLIASEKTALERDNISLVPEEPLFQDYIAFNEHLLALNGRSQNSPLVSKYLDNVNQLNAVADHFNVQIGYFDEQSLLDVLPGYHSDFFSLVKSNNVVFPLLKKAFTGTLGFLNSRSKTEALQALQTFSAFQLFSSVNELIGERNSLASEFSEMMNLDSQHRLELTNKQKEFTGDLSALIDSIQFELNSIDESQFSGVDRAFVQELSALQETSSVLSSTDSLPASLSEFKQFNQKKLQEFSSQYSSLSSSIYLNKISLGESVSQFKVLQNDLLDLQNEVTDFSNHSFNNLKALCDSRMEFMRGQVENTEILSSTPIEIQDFISAFNYLYDQYRSDSNLLVVCQEAYKTYFLLQASQKNYLLFKETSNNQLDACLSDLDALFSNSDSLTSFKPIYDQLKLIAPTQDNLLDLLQSCRSLYGDVLRALSDQPDIQHFESLWKSISSDYSDLEYLSKAFPRLVSNGLIEGYYGRLQSLNSYVEENRFDAVEGLSILPSLIQSAEKLQNDIHSDWKKIISTILISTSVTKINSLEELTANIPQSSNSTVLLKNPLNRSISESFYLSFPLLPEGKEITSISSNISSFSFSGKNLELELNSLPLLTEIHFHSSQTVAETTEKAKILSADSRKAIIEHLVNLNVNSGVPKLIVLIAPLYPSISDVTVLNGEKQIPFSLVSGNIQLTLLQPSSSSFTLYYSIPSPLKVELTPIQTIQQDQNTMLYSYILRVKNQTSLSFSSISVFVDFPAEHAELNLRDGSNSISIQSQSFSGFTFQLKDLSPQQAVELSLSSTVHDFKNYWLSTISRMTIELQEIADSKSSFSDDALVLLNQSKSLAENSQNLASLNEFISAFNVLESKYNSFLSNETQYLALKKQVEEKLKTAEETALFLQKTSFEHAQEWIEEYGKSKQLFQQAEEFFHSGQYDSAFKMLLKVNSLLNDSNSSYSSILISQKKILSDKIKPYTKSSSRVLEKFSMLENKFNHTLLQSDLNSSQQVVGELSLLSTEAELDSRTRAETAFSSLKLKFSEFNSLKQKLSKSIPSLLEELTAVKDIVNSTQYLMPITESRLKELNLKLTDVKDLSSPFSEIESVMKNENYLSAIEKMQSFQSDLSSTLTKLQSIDQEVSSKQLKLKTDAELLFSKTSDRLAGSSDSKTKSFLEKAKSELEKGNYIKSVAISSSLTGLASTSSLSQNYSQFFIPALAFMLLVGGFFGIQKLKNKNNKKEKELKPLPKLK